MYRVQTYYTRRRSAFAPAPGAPSLLRCCYAVTTSRQGEHHERAARVADIRVVAEGANRAERGGRILRADPQSDALPGPAAPSGEPGDVLLAVGPQVRHRVPDDAGGRLELPQLRAGRGIDRLEPAFHRAVEHDAAGRRQRAAVGRQVFLDLPLLGPRGRVPRHERAPDLIGPGVHPHDGAHVPLAGGVLHVHALIVHADVVRRDVEEPGLRRVRGGLLILEADRGRTDALGVLLRGRPVLRIADRDARLEIDLRRPVRCRVRVRLRHEYLPFVRSTTYPKPLRSKCASAFTAFPPIVASNSTISLTPS